MNFLACDDKPRNKFSPPGNLPPEVLQMGRLVDYTDLEPGDLVLSRDEQADWVSQGIARVQQHIDRGVNSAHASFTHAMLYIGAGMVLEATFEFKKPDVELRTSIQTFTLMAGMKPGKGGKKKRASKSDPDKRLHGVFVTHLGYYGGHHSLRARRPVALRNNPRHQQEMVANALSLFSLDYDFAFIRQLGVRILFPNSVLPDELVIEASQAAVVCSTFYARAYDMTIMDEGLTGGDGGACTPSFLSHCEGFEDVPLRWGKVGK